MSIQTSSSHQISINAILAQQIREAVADYADAKRDLKTANRLNHSDLKVNAMRKLNKARAALKRIANATYQYYYG